MPKSFRDSIFDCPNSRNEGIEHDKILLADHQCLFRAGMVRLIDSIGGFGVTGEVDSAEAAVEFVAQHTLAILLLEISMLGIWGFETMRRI